MRDLYKRLSIRSDAMPQSIMRAIDSCGDMSLREDARFILENAEIKKAYDQAHRTVSRIARLRSNLGLRHTSNWSGALPYDFECPPTRELSQLDKLKSKISTGASENSTSYQIGRLIGRLLLRKPRVITLVVLLLAGWIYSSCDSETSKVVLSDGKSNSAVVSNQIPTFRSTNSYAGMFDDLPRAPRKNTPEPILAQLFNEREISLPQSGELQTFTSDERMAPFEIRSASGGNYLVKLVDAYSKSDVLTIFIRGGVVVNVDVPLGSYEVRYAAGDRWYGYEHLFGPETVCSKADKTFTFKVEGNQISGFTLTLYKVSHGNLHTSKIPRANF